MLHTETVTEKTLELIRMLQHDKAFENFYLVGGTALSLRMGHRVSVDIDLFTAVDFDAATLAKHLSIHYRPSELQQLKNGIICYLHGIKLDLIAHLYPIIHPPETIEEIRMLSLAEIGAMKINAIHGKGSRLKDFVDMYFLLEHLPLEKMTDTAIKKYSKFNTSMAYNALLYHRDIQFGQKVEFMNNAIPWENIADRLRAVVQNKKKVFNENEMYDNLAPKPRRRKKGR